MKKIVLATLIVALTGLAVAQGKRKAAIIGLTTSKTTSSYIGKMPQVVNDDGRCLIDNSPAYHDSIGFKILKNKIDSILKLMDFRLIAEDSVLKSANYADISRKIASARRQSQVPSLESTAKGYGFTERAGFGGLAYSKEYFNFEPRPDIIIDASIDFQVNFSTKSGKDIANLVCNVYIKSFTEKNKKPFKFKISYTYPKELLVKGSASCSGYELAEDISRYKKEAIAEAMKLLDKDVAKEVEDVKEFYSK